MAWVERFEPWNHVEVQYCEVTGQLLPRRYWEFEVAGQVLRTVGPRYESLYRWYVLREPRSGDLERPDA